MACDTPSLRFGIIGTGAIAEDFATALRSSSSCRVVNAVGSAPGRATAFAEKYDLPNHADTLDQLLADPDVDAVYIATPHTLHEPHAFASLAAGKHVLCEKPLTTCLESTQRVLDAAAASGLFLMEAFMYRCHPLTAKLIELIKSGAIGEVKHIDADFCFHVERDPTHRLFNPDLAGGAILDVGGYPASFVRLIAGVTAGKPFDEPTDFTAIGEVGPTGVDELAEASLTFAAGITAKIRCAIAHDLGTTATITGTAGTITLPDPWIPQSDRQGLKTSLQLQPATGASKTLQVITEKPTYAIEAELMATTIAAGQTQPPWPAMQWDDTLGNMRLLQTWRNKIK